MKPEDTLAALRLPDLKGKRFLLVGDVKGYYKSFAEWNGAPVVKTINICHAENDNTKRVIVNQNEINSLQPGFDVVLILSFGKDYENPRQLIQNAIELLRSDGVLVLELYIKNRASYENTPNAVNEPPYVNKAFTRDELNKLLNGFAWKRLPIDSYVKQKGVQKYSVHVSKLKPYVFLFIQKPGTGKTTVSRRLLGSSEIPLVSGDLLYQRIAKKSVEVSSGLFALVHENFSTATINKTILKVFEGGYAEELIDLWIKQVNGQSDFAIDSFVPDIYKENVKSLLSERGFFPVELNWSQQTTFSSSKNSIARAQGFKAYLKKSKGIENNYFKVIKLLNKELYENIRWHLDSPIHKSSFSSKQKEVKINGWLLGLGTFKQKYNVYLSFMGGTKVFEPTRSRGDVITANNQRMNREELEFWQNQPCGFSVRLNAEVFSDDVELGVIFNNVKYPIARIKLESKTVSFIGWFNKG